MSWDEKLAGIIDYVEEHLQRTQDDIDKKEIEKLAECSYTFFLKVFSYMYGIGFGEYIRNRKLTLAGYDLKSTNDKVIDISYRYGYDSPTSFTKAFQQFHGVTPKMAKTSDVNLRIYPKMKIKTDCLNVAWSLQRKPAFRLLGKAKQISCVNGNNYMEIPAFWSECQQNGEISRVVALDDAESKGTMDYVMILIMTKSKFLMPLRLFLIIRNQMILWKCSYRKQHGRYLYAKAAFLRQYKTAGRI